MSLTLDFLSVILVLVFVVIGFKRGIVKTIISALGTALTAIVSMLLSTPIATSLYNSLVKNTITEKVEDALKLSKQTASGNPIDQILDTMPKFVHNSLLNFGLSSTKLSSVISQGPAQIERMLSPIIISFMSLFVSIFLFIMLTVIVKIASKVIYSFLDIPVIDFVNSFFGALVGLLEGFVILLLIAFIVRLSVPHLKTVPEIISDETISESTVFKGVYDSPILTGIVKNNTDSPNSESVE